MFFNEEEVEKEYSYGDIVRPEVFFKKIEEVMKNSGLIFEMQYQSGKAIHLNTANDLIFQIYMTIKDKLIK